MNKLMLSLIFSGLLVFTTQSRTITGIVTDAKSKPLDHATVKIGDKKVVTNAAGQFTYTTDLSIDNAIVYKSSYQFKKIAIAQSNDNYSVVLDTAVYSKEFAPPLRVLGGMLYNAKDRPALLQGLSIHEAPNLKESDFVNFSQNWKVNVVRLVMHNHDRKDADWPDYLNKVDSVMKWSKKYKIYVLVDGYHEAGSSGSVVSHWDRVQKVWDRLMPRLKNYDHVIWQIYNEPNGEGGNNWTEWAPYAKILVDKIRSYKPVVNAITVPAAVWATDLDLTKASFDREEIVFSFHPYFGRPSPHKAAMWDVRFGYLQKQDIAPVFCSEWAAHDGGGDTADQKNTYFRPIMRYFRDNNVHFSHWGYFPSWGGMPNLVSSRIGEAEKRTIWGDLLFNYFNGTAWDSLISPPLIPGKIQAENFDAFQGLRTEGASDEGGGQCLSYVTNGSWTSYSAKSNVDAWYKFTIRASGGGSGAKVTILVDGVKKASLEITSTGGWQMWKTFSASESFNIPKGDHQIKLEYTGGSSLFNVNWFTLDGSNEVLPQIHSEIQDFQIVKKCNTVTVHLPQKSKNQQLIGIFNIDGSLVKRIPIDNNQSVVQVGELTNGTYLVKISGNHNFYQKLVISGSY